MNVGGGFVVLGGIFFLAAVSLRWAWFRDHYKVRYLVQRLGRTGTTVFYVVCGVVCVIVGVLMMLQIIPLE